MTTAIVIDPALSGTGDLHHAAAVGWVDAAHGAGLEVRILGRRDGAPVVIDVFPVEQAFDRAPDAFTKEAPRQARLRVARRVVRDGLERSLGGIAADDILILSRARLPELDGVAAWASSYACDELPRLIVWIAQAPLDDPFVERLGSTAPLIAAFDRLRALFGARAAFLTSDADLAARYAALGCGRFGCLPHAALCRRDAAADDEALRALRLQVLKPLLTDDPAPDTPTDPVAVTLPGVDIVVTLHNYARFLNGCLASVANQTYPNWRCIVVDDASTDIAFETLRALVAAFGPRFSVAPHLQAERQTQAVATGFSLGANPFVVILDADDRLEPDALDKHMAWHLNSAVPAAMTCGQMRVVDARGRLLSGALDNIVRFRVERVRALPPDAAFRRPDASFDPGPAQFADRDLWSPADWLWAASSAMMFRRSLVELVLPDDVSIGFAADTYLAFSAHMFGSSILIDAQVARYTRHGGNAFANTTLYGAATLAYRPAVGGSWTDFAAVLRRHIERNRARFDDQINVAVVARVLALLSTGAGMSVEVAAPRPPPFGPRVMRRLRHEARRLRALARRIGLGPPAHS